MLVLVVLALVLSNYAVGSHATCTIINTSDVPVQVVQEPLNVSAAANVTVEVAAHATVAFSVDISVQVTFKNENTGHSSPVISLVDNTLLLVQASAAAAAEVDVAVASLDVNGRLTAGSTLVSSL